MECLEGQCIADEYRFFCTKQCQTDDQCPEYMYCGNFGNEKKCIYRDTNEGDGQGIQYSDCSIHGQSDCMSIFTCVNNINNRNESKCLKECQTDYDCAKDYKCIINGDKSYCIPPANKKTGEICNRFGNTECKNLEDTCITITQNYEKFCTRECTDNNDCPDNTVCKEIDNKKYCLANGVSDIGETCKNSGTMECKDGLICDTEYLRGALCTKECENDNECPPYNSCSITYDDKKLCRPAINGLGDRTKEIGMSCKNHGDSDCKENLFCLTASIDDDRAFCTKHCEINEDCPQNYHCANTFGNSHKVCVKGNKGELGANCYNESCNQGLFCNLTQLKDYTAICTRTCETIGEECEKEGYYCNEISNNFKICLDKKPVLKGKLGEPCGQCIDGLLCIYDDSGNFCSQRCSEDNPCPEGFACQNYDENNLFCYKAQ